MPKFGRKKPQKAANRITAMMDTDLTSLKSFLEEMSLENWRRTLNKYGMTPLQQTIHDHNKEAFNVLLPYHDSTDLEIFDTYGRTVLMVAFKCSTYRELFTTDLILMTKDRIIDKCHEYFAVELIKRDILLDKIYDHGTYLHIAIGKCSPEITRLLLEKGIDVNSQDKFGNTALHKLFSLEREQSVAAELLTMLLYFEADPTVENHVGLTPIDYALRYKTPVEICEYLFLHTFDELAPCKLRMQVLVLMSYKLPALLNRLMRYSVEIVPFNRDKERFYFFPVHSIDLVHFWLNCDPEFLKFLLQNNSCVISDMLAWLGRCYITDSNERKYDLLLRDKSIRNLNVLLESQIKYDTIEFLQAFRSEHIFEKTIEKYSQEDAVKIFAFLLSYGVHFEPVVYDVVYRSYGYCDLFKLLLQIEPSSQVFLNFSKKLAMPALIYDISLNFAKLFQPHSWYTNAEELLDYFAHPKVTTFLVRYPSVCRDLAKAETRIRGHPKVPLLQELARDAFRLHFIRIFNITCTREFYSLLKVLPISPTHEKLITYEKKLY